MIFKIRREWERRNTQNNSLAMVLSSSLQRFYTDNNTKREFMGYLYYAPCVVPGTDSVSQYNNPYEESAVIVSVLLMRKLRHRGIKRLSQVHIAGECHWVRRGKNPAVWLWSMF